MSQGTATSAAARADYVWFTDADIAHDAGILRALVEKAEEYADAVMPGLTHMQHAQPVLLAHVLLAYVEMLERDVSRLADCRARLDVSPLGACALAGTMGNKIMDSSTGFFGNRSMPGGILTAPGAISDETAARLKAAFEANFSGANAGRLAVLGDGLKFEPMMMTAEAAQLAEQLKWTVDDIARAFHYPAFKLGGPLPPYAGNVEALITAYYTDCLQILIESLELLLDEGLSLPSDMGTELDLDNLMRMDTTALFEANSKRRACFSLRRR